VDIKITRDKLKAFWEYGKLRLLIALALSVAVFYLLYFVTAPSVHRTKKFEILTGGVSQTTGAEAWVQDILTLLPDQQTCEIQALDIESYDSDTYMLVATRMTSQEGDLFVLPYTMYQSLACSDNMVNLLDHMPGDEQGRTILECINLPEGVEAELCRLQVTHYDREMSDYVTESEICGVPAECLSGLVEIGVVPTDYVLCIPDYRDIDVAQVVKVINWMFENKQEYTDYEGNN